MKPETILEAGIDYATALFKGEPTGHDIYHTLRVFKLANYIQSQEGGDPFLTGLIALLHDVDDAKLFPKTHAGLIHAKAFLSEHVDGKTQDLVLASINDISFKGKDTKAPASLEGRIVQDADRIDALGAIGVARAFAYGGHKGRLIYDPEEKPLTGMSESLYRSHKSCTVNHFYEKLFLLSGMMNTKTGKRIAAGRDRYLHGFLDEFLSEWDERNLSPLASRLGMTPHPEGGYFKETFKGDVIAGRPSYSSILFLLEEGQQSSLHVLEDDELWYYQGGNSLDIIAIRDGKLSVHKLGKEIEKGESYQVLMPKGTIFGSRCLAGYSLSGCMVCPAFDYRRFRIVTEADLKGLSEKDLAIARPLLLENA